jgi:hypothetical protein
MAKKGKGSKPALRNNKNAAGPHEHRSTVANYTVKTGGGARIAAIGGFFGPLGTVLSANFAGNRAAMLQGTPLKAHGHSILNRHKNVSMLGHGLTHSMLGAVGAAAKYQASKGVKNATLTGYKAAGIGGAVGGALVGAAIGYGAHKLGQKLSMYKKKRK